jgi:hypothetical protein
MTGLYDEAGKLAQVQPCLCCLELSEPRRRRLRVVAKYYRADEVVLFSWKRGGSTGLFTLSPKLEWEPVTCRKNFSGEQDRKPFARPTCFIPYNANYSFRS